MSDSTVAIGACKSARPLVSIVTVCLNQRRFIVDTLESVMSQAYWPIEHIVVDGGSTDGTVEVLRQYAAKYDLRWASEADRGLSHAFNKGVIAASGQWLYFLNGDDYLVDSDAIGRVMEWIVSHPGHSIYMGSTVGVDEHGAEIARSETPPVNTIYTRDDLLNEGAPVIHQGTFYHRRVFMVAGPYSEKYRTHMDYEFHLRASRYFDIAVMGVPVACFRMHLLALSQQAQWRRSAELLGARVSHGGSLWHRDNLRFIRGFLATWPATRWLVRWLGGTRLRTIISWARGSRAPDTLE